MIEPIILDIDGQKFAEAMMPYIEPVAIQLTFDYEAAGFSPALAISLEQHAVFLEGFTKRYVSRMGQELAEAKAEIHEEKQTGWAKWVEGRLGITVQHADRCIAAWRKSEHLVQILPPIEPVIEDEQKPYFPMPALESELGPFYGPFEHGQDLRVREDDIEPLPKLTEEQRYIVQVEAGSIEYAREAHVFAKELDKRNGVPPALQMSESNEWYTPQKYIDAARELMGGIDLDPASCAFANETVKAANYYDITQNGLDKIWTGRIWLNPPYGFDDGTSNQEAWSTRLVEQYNAGVTTEAVLLVNAVTDRKWFQPLWQFPICFTDHRIRFYNAEVEAGQPTHGNALIYFGKQEERFIALFKQFGPIVKRVG